MGLISTEVEVTLSSKKISYYDNLGYEIPKVKTLYGMCTPRGTKITVKPEDLSSGSHVKVTVQCDGCSKIYKTTYLVYYNHNHDGKIYCNSCANKLFNSGENHPRWNFNKSYEERLMNRRYPEYTTFVKSVLARDNYTCQYCGKRGGNLEVHHLDGYDWCKDKRTVITNGITLCDCCHSLFHSIYGLGGNTKEQYETWVKKKDIVLQTYNGEIPRNRWAYCVDDSEIIKDINCYAKEHGFHPSSVYKCCNGQRNTLYKKVYMWYDEYIKLSSEEITMIMKKKKIYI